MKKLFILFSTVAAGALSFVAFKKKQEVDALQLLDYEFKRIGLDQITAEKVFLELMLVFKNGSPYRFTISDLAIDLFHNGQKFASSFNSFYVMPPKKEQPFTTVAGVGVEAFARVVAEAVKTKNYDITVAVRLEYFSNTLGVNVPVDFTVDVDLKETLLNYLNLQTKNAYNVKIN
jgi:hypothetical protein